MSIGNDIPISAQEVDLEFNKSTERSHVIACWVGIILNLVWFISDYFVMPNYWLSFMGWRVTISIVSLILLMLRKKISITIYQCLFILVLGISIQNSYMWSVMDEAHMKQHTFAYIALFIGTGMLVLWELYFSVLLISLTVFFNMVFFYLYQKNISFGEFMIDGGLLTFSVGIFCMFLIRSRYRLTKAEIRSRLQLSKSKEIIEIEHALVLQQKIQIETQKDLLEEINKEVRDSINYAKRIQSALIPAERDFQKHFQESFIFFKPKDIVSGDFYWMMNSKNKIFYATADCTGHGVPGGFMTMLGLSFLDEIVKVHGVNETDEILNLLRDKIISTLKQTGQLGENKDGMDIALCCVDLENKSISYSGANNSIYVLYTAQEELSELKPDKQPCGFFEAAKPFSKKLITIESGMMIYSFTDGYADQFGGPKGKKFKYKQLENLLSQHASLPMPDQKTNLENAMNDWMQDRYPQVDDMLVIGLKLI